MSDPRAIIQLRQLTYIINNHIIIDHVDLDIYEREIFAVMGLSGCGKTTLLRLMCGLISPTSGSIRVLDQEITRLSESKMNAVREHMGLVFQYGALFDSLSVGENVGFRLYEQTNLSDEQIYSAIDEKLHLVGLPGTESLMPAEVSGGMQKRIGIARALMGNPEMLLYDEPTSGLDPIIAATIDRLIVDLRNKVGVTEVIVSHDVHSVLRMADRMALLYGGRFRLIGTTDEFDHSTDPVVRQFLEGQTDGPIQVV